MRQLSISAAWEETRAIIARDGSLLMAVALALVALPTAINSLLNPGGMNAVNATWWANLIAFASSIIALAGQLSLIRLAASPSITVGAAIAHGLRRMPIYFVVILILVAALFLIAIPIVLVLGAMGVPLNAKPLPISGPVVAATLLFLALLIFFGVRLLLSSPVASLEDAGPIAIIRRSWSLTSRHWLPLLGFLLVFVVGAVLLLTAVGAAVGSVVVLLLGPIQPLSAGALIIALVQSLVNAAITTLFAVMLARIYLQLTDRAGQVGEVFR